MKRLLEQLQRDGHIRDVKIDPQNKSIYAFVLTRPLIELQVRRKASDLGFGVTPDSHDKDIAQRGFNVYPDRKVDSFPVIMLLSNIAKLGWQRPNFKILEGKAPLTAELRRKIARFFESLGK